MPKTHVLSSNTSNFGITSKTQELLCFVGQGYVFEDASKLLQTTIGIDISAKQIQRVSEYYGEKLEQQELQIAEESIPAPILKAIKEQDEVYCMMDGSMVFTREEKWKEMKVGRLFAAKDCVQIQKNRSIVSQSLYLCHFGTHNEFFDKWENYTAPYKHKIFIADGAKWLWNWVEDTYPESTKILDYFHAVEKLGTYATQQYTDEKERKQWMTKHKKLLLNNKVKKIIATLHNTVSTSKHAEKTKADVIRYYQNNIEKMQYKTFVEKGYLIGSGAIESAHRNVVQQRLKLSGQRWSKKGAQQIVNLRAYSKSDRWNEVVELFKIAA